MHFNTSGAEFSDSKAMAHIQHPLNDRHTTPGEIGGRTITPLPAEKSDNYKAFKVFLAIVAVFLLVGGSAAAGAIFHTQINAALLAVKTSVEIDIYIGLGGLAVIAIGGLLYYGGKSKALKNEVRLLNEQFPAASEPTKKRESRGARYQRLDHHSKSGSTRRGRLRRRQPPKLMPTSASSLKNSGSKINKTSSSSSSSDYDSE